jgi:hypothetical protein
MSDVITTRKKLCGALGALSSHAAQTMEPEAARAAIVALGLAMDLDKAGSPVVETLQALRNQVQTRRR